MTTGVVFLDTNFEDEDPNNQGVVTQYTYDQYGNPATSMLMMNVGTNGAATNQPNQTTTTVYDALGQLISESLPDPANGSDDSQSPTTRYTYDADGNQTSMTDAAGNVTYYEYDTMDRLTETQLPAPGGASETPQKPRPPAPPTTTMGMSLPRRTRSATSPPTPTIAAAT